MATRGFWSSALFVARAEARHSLRARENVLWVFVMPAVFFYFIGTVTGGMGRSAGAEKPRLGLVEPSGSDVLTERVVRRLSEQGFEVVRGEKPPRRRDAWSCRPAFGESVAAGKGVEVIFVPGDGGLAAQYHRIRVARAVYTVLADVVVTRQVGQPLDVKAFEKLDAMPRNVTLSVRSAGQRRHIPTGFEHAIPGTTVMFTMMILLTGGSIPLVVERRQGLLRRLASSPIPRAAIVLGKWGGKMVLATVQVCFAMLVGTALFRMDWGGTFPMVAVVLFSWAAFSASLAMLLGSLARTEAQAAGIGVVFSMGLAALGGCWWPVEITADWMQRLALFLPTGWAMDAMHQLVSFGAGASAAVPHVLGLAAASLLIGILAARSFRFA